MFTRGFERLMKIAIISSLILLILFCYDNNKVDKAKKEALLCLTLSYTISENDLDKHLFGSLVCLDYGLKKVQKEE